MTLVEAILLGVAQGLTEFLPISSSGHLVVLQSLLGISHTAVTFEIALHFATMLAILLFFQRQIRKLDIQQLQMLALATIPVAAVGVLLKDPLVGLFNSLELVAYALLGSGAINMAIHFFMPKHTFSSEQKLSTGRGILIGCFQVIALIPGISRSGSTLFGGIMMGADRKQAFEFSFLLAIPAIVGATFLQLLEVLQGDIAAPALIPLGAGMATAFLTGYASLWLLRYMLKSAKFHYFAAYCFAVGSALLAHSWFLS